MIYESLIVPYEKPVSLRDIKRSILTYDKVKIIDPDDRDIMPSNTYWSTILGIPLLGMDMGPIRPMGKTLGYDARFQLIVDACAPAIQQGLVEIVSSYNKQEIPQGMTIGATPTGGYPLSTQFVFWLYRSIAQSQQFLRAAITADKNSLLSDMAAGVSLQGQGDGSINDIPALPMIADGSLDVEQNTYITQIARARIGALIKYAGFCEMKDLVPVFPYEVYGDVISELLNNAHVVLSSAEDDPYWLNRNRVLTLCHEEFLDDDALDALSIEQAIKLRTAAWGHQAEAREALFASVAEIAQDVQEDFNFKKTARKLIREYKQAAETLELERGNLRFKISCDLASGVLKAGAAYKGLLALLQSPLPSMGVTLLAGGVWIIDKGKEYVPVLRELRAKEETMKRGAGFGLQNFYSRIKRLRRS